MTKLQRRIGVTVAWTAVSTAVGCLIMTLMSGGLTVGLLGKLFGGVVERDGAFVFAVSALGAISGAVIGDMPGLRRPHSMQYLAWFGQQRDRLRFSALREGVALVVGWLLLCLVLQKFFPVAPGVWLVFFAFGVARVLQLGRHLHLRELYRRSRTAVTDS